MEEKETIKITDENGKEKEVEVLHYFTLNSNNKDYLIYTENEEDEKGDILVYSSEVIEKDNEVELKAITDEKILAEVTEVLKELISEGE